jgi:hypothetical protein
LGIHNVITLSMIEKIPRTSGSFFSQAVRQFLDSLQEAMDTIVREVLQTPAKSSNISVTRVEHVIKRCLLSWRSIHAKYQRNLEHINAELVPDLTTIITTQRSLGMVAEALLRTVYDTHGAMASMISLEKQNRETSCQVNALIRTVPEWNSVPQTVHDKLSLCATKLERQKMDLAFMCLLSAPSHMLK